MGPVRDRQARNVRAAAQSVQALPLEIKHLGVGLVLARCALGWPV
jgi:hypothetical protein